MDTDFRQLALLAAALSRLPRVETGTMQEHRIHQREEPKVELTRPPRDRDDEPWRRKNHIRKARR